MGVIYKNGVRYGGSGTDNGEATQVTSMPAASSLLVNKIVQYVGPTTADYTNAYFYKCIEDKTTTPTSYRWIWQEVQSTLLSIDPSTEPTDDGAIWITTT